MGVVRGVVVLSAIKNGEEHNVGLRTVARTAAPPALAKHSTQQRRSCSLYCTVERQGVVSHVNELPINSKGLILLARVVSGEALHVGGKKRGTTTPRS